MATIDGEGWRTAAFAETAPVVYTVDEASARRGERGRPVRALLGRVGAGWRASLSRLRRPWNRGRRPPP
jgi:hypothetical protein